MLAGKGLSSEDIFNVINSSTPIKSASEILMEAIDTQKQDGETNYININDLNQDNENIISKRKELISTVSNGLIENNNQMMASNQQMTNNLPNFSNFIKFKDIKNKRDLKAFLKKKRKEYNIDNTLLKEYGKEKKDSVFDQINQVPTNQLISNSNLKSNSMQKHITNGIATNNNTILNLKESNGNHH